MSDRRKSAVSIQSEQKLEMKWRLREDENKTQNLTGNTLQRKVMIWWIIQWISLKMKYRNNTLV